ncbi:MAG: hypothetical protein ACC682_05660 [Gemmatimonadota bacterium]
MAAECDRFGRYLIGAPVSRYARDWYDGGLARFPDRFAPRARADRVLLRMSVWPWFPLRAVDMTARFVAPSGAVRRRLVFLTAVLENAPDSFERYEIPGVRSRAGFFIGLAARGLLSGFALAFGLLVTAAAYLVGVGR